MAEIPMLSFRVKGKLSAVAHLVYGIRGNSEVFSHLLFGEYLFVPLVLHQREKFFRYLLGKIGYVGTGKE